MTWQELYYLAVPLGGLAIVFTAGLCSNWRLGFLPAGGGFAVNLATQLEEGGPGLCCGFVVFPLIFTVVAFAGRGLRGVLIGYGWISEPRAPTWEPTCANCGYCLIGLPTNVCPECGQTFDPDIRPPDESTDGK